jgi:hypothetical protein
MSKQRIHFFRHLTATILGLVVGAMFGTKAQAEKSMLHLASEAKQCSLVELYSSEGCSSCPPAEEWLGALKNDDRLWKQFVPLSFHVDYWDYLGWKDRWAKPGFANQQRHYSQIWGTRSVYTPGFVVDGKEWRNWGGKTLPQKTSKTGVLTVNETESGKFTVQFNSSNVVTSVGNQGHHVKFALLGFDISSKVTAGENSGKTLHHDFVVLSLQTGAITDGKATFELKTSDRPTASRHAIAVWITDSGETGPLQAVGGWWEP